MKVLFIVIFALLITGCATTHKQTRADIVALRDARQEASIHYFKNVTLSEVEQAVIKLFTLLDGGDVEFDVRSNKILVSRWWTYYAVFTVGFGMDYWEFVLTPDSEGIRVSSAFTSERNDGPFAGRVTTPFKENIGIGGNIHDGASEADYYLLYSRIEYLLGQRGTWMTCEEVKRIHRNSGEEIVLCDRIGLENKYPKMTHSPEKVNTTTTTVEKPVSQKDPSMTYGPMNPDNYK